MKRIISLTLACLFVLGAVSQPSAAMTQRELNEQATDMYNTVMIERFEEEGYPDSYGGAWLNTDSGRLVIGLTERSEETEQTYYDITGADLLEFQTVEYSLQEIYDTMKETAENVSRANNVPQIKAGAIIQRTNSARMYVSEEDVAAYISESRVTMLPQNELESLKANPDIIEFQVSGDVIFESVQEDVVANVGEGFKINTSGTTALASLGYLAYRYENGVKQVGVVTAAHTYNRLEEYEIAAYTMDNMPIGFCTLKKLNLNPVGQTTLDEIGTQDFVFLEYPLGVSVSPVIKNDTAYSQDFNIRYVLPAENRTIYKSGTVTLRTSGTVESIYYLDWSHKKVPELGVGRILSNYISSPGDSGGIVYIRGDNGKAKVVGIHQGRVPLNVDSHALCIPASHLEAAGIFNGQ